MRFHTQFVLLAVLFCNLSTPAFAQNWYKGNTHTHTSNSDGDSDLITVARWYRDNNWDFLVVTDHNMYTPIASAQTTINNENAASGHKPFLIIPGQELSDRPGSSIHLTGMNTSGVIDTQGGSSVTNKIQRATDAIQAKGGLPILNHPNLGSGITPAEAGAVRDLKFFELINGHPGAKNSGGGGLPTMGDWWDDVLGRPHIIYGVGADDSHHFKTFGPDKANPGRAWIQVNAPALTASAIVGAMYAGNFYVSTGVTYGTVNRSGNQLSMSLPGAGPFNTVFTGKNGAVLKTDTSAYPSYNLPIEGQLYVRAKTSTPYGTAWTQPLFDKHFIVDNAGSGFSASSNWVIGSAGADKFKTNYHYRQTMSGSPDRAKFTVNTAGTGDFDIYAWWSVGTAGNRTPEAHYFIPGGTEVVVNQRVNGGQWNYLGTVRFNAEGDHTVELAAGGPAGYAVIADAVMMYGPK